MMTRDEIIKEYEAAVAAHAAAAAAEIKGAAKSYELFKAGLSALRPVSREQVEKVWRGEWIPKHYVDGILEGTNFDECSKCGYQRVFENPELKTKYMFCPGCGRAMWDEAVEMVMERLEALKYGKGD